LIDMQNENGMFESEGEDGESENSDSESEEEGKFDQYE
jgi:hypothetical protein